MNTSKQHFFAVSNIFIWDIFMFILI